MAHRFVPDPVRDACLQCGMASVEAVRHGGDHEHCSADDCITAKLRYWRVNGTPAAHYQGGRKQFHENTLRELADHQVAEARAAGIDPVPVGARWV